MSVRMTYASENGAQTVPLDGVAFGVHDLALALGDAGIRIGGGGRGRVDGKRWNPPHAIGII